MMMQKGAFGMRRAFHTSSKLLKTIKIGDTSEVIVERSEFPITKCKDILKDEIITIMGYGPQGRGQGLNMRDQGFNVAIGLVKSHKDSGRDWDGALKDGWVEGKNLFEFEEALDRGTYLQYLVSDAGQIGLWPTVKKHLRPGKTLYFSHGFGIVYKDHTKIIAPKDVDVVLCAPKGSGLTVRNHFLEGRGINGSYAIHQDVSGKARERVIAAGMAIGCGHLFETTFEQEVYSDLTGERCVLMGMLQGAFLAQYEVLRAAGHSPSEAYNETIEEALCSLYPLVADKGMDWMFANCSTTAQRGALDWAPKFHKAIKPVIEECYARVKDGSEAKRSIDLNSATGYRAGLEKELKEIADQEMWQAARVLRELRPENAK
jgi:ketol-acid reductoisomerase